MVSFVVCGSAVPARCILQYAACRPGECLKYEGALPPRLLDSGSASNGACNKPIGGFWACTSSSSVCIWWDGYGCALRLNGKVSRVA